MIRSAPPLAASAATQRALQDDYYRYIDAGPKPSIVVIQDLDDELAGFGAFWGESWQLRDTYYEQGHAV